MGEEGRRVVVGGRLLLRKVGYSNYMTAIGRGLSTVTNIRRMVISLRRGATAIGVGRSVSRAAFGRTLSNAGFGMANDGWTGGGNANSLCSY